MARIRSVHPALFTDEGWVSCSAIARVLFIALWTDADDRGVFEWKPLQIKMRLLPADNVDVERILGELAGAGMLRSFSEDGKNYGAIKDFQKFQHPQKPRAQYPLPDSLVAFVTGLGEAQADLFPDQSRTGRVESNQMERRGEEDGEKVEGRGRRRAAPDTPVPEGFPDQEAIDYASEQFSTARVRIDPGREAQKFRDHNLSKGKLFKDWRAAWRTWVANAIGWAEPAANVVDFPNPLTPSEEAAIDLRRWRFWMEDWKKGNPWDRKIRGPRPDELECRIPEPIMAEFGHTPVRRAEG